jgi:hypothetical protein
MANVLNYSTAENIADTRTATYTLSVGGAYNYWGSDVIRARSSLIGAMADGYAWSGGTSTVFTGQGQIFPTGRS